MKKSAQKIRATTQLFTEIRDIRENIVLLSSSNACLVIEVKAINFALLSVEEQQAKMVSYSALLNSLSFPIQIIVQNKKLDISSYIKLLDEAEKTSQNKFLATQIGLYRNFVLEVVKQNSVLDKKFYIVIPYSSFERGPIEKKVDFFTLAKDALVSKAQTLHSQLKSVGLLAKTLDNQELIFLFYQFYNEEDSFGKIEGESQTPFVKPSLTRSEKS